jgi:sugar (pentulose or hexulose) kinase
MKVHTVTVGIDIGTTAAKALTCTTEGRVVDAVLRLWHPRDAPPARGKVNLITPRVLETARGRAIRLPHREEDGQCNLA